MKYPVFHSIPEVLTYGMLILVILLNLTVLIVIKQDTQELQHQQACLVGLFFKPNRASLTLADISGCSNVTIKPQ